MDTLLFALTSYGYRYFTLNLLKSLKQTNTTCDIIIYCLDKESKEFFENEKYYAVHINSTEFVPDDFKELMDFGSLYFQKINFYKHLIMENLLKNIPSNIRYIIYLDGDIIVFRDFIPYIKSICADPAVPGYIFQSDEEDISVKNINSRYICGGIIIVDRSKIGSSKYIFTLDNPIWKTMEDQGYMQYKVKTLNIPHYTLDRDLFPNGVYLRNNKWVDTNPFLLHYNWVIGDEKEVKMKQNNHWLLN